LHFNWSQIGCSIIKECDPSHRCIIENKKFIACLKVSGEGNFPAVWSFFLIYQCTPYIFLYKNISCLYQASTLWNYNLFLLRTGCYCEPFHVCYMLCSPLMPIVQDVLIIGLLLVHWRSLAFYAFFFVRSLHTQVFVKGVICSCHLNWRSPFVSAGQVVICSCLLHDISMEQAKGTARNIIFNLSFIISDILPVLEIKVAAYKFTVAVNDAIS